MPKLVRQWTTEKKAIFRVVREDNGAFVWECETLDAMGKATWTLVPAPPRGFGGDIINSLLTDLLKP